MNEVPEPRMETEDWEDLGRGIDLFNAGRFWHAHEAWEEVWRRKRRFPSHVFFKGLIQLTAAHHQREQGRFDGMMTHFDRAQIKLTPFAPAFLGIAIDPLLASLESGRREGLRLGPNRIQEFDPVLVPQIRRPGREPGL